MTKFVAVESPYTGKSEAEIRRNLLYARACVRDCIMRGETPVASHLFFTQPGILDDNIPKERKLGISAGMQIVQNLPGIVTAIYQDLGISRGMQYAIEQAEKENRLIEYRTLDANWEKEASDFTLKHSQAGLWGMF